MKKTSLSLFALFPLFIAACDRQDAAAPDAAPDAADTATEEAAGIAEIAITDGYGDEAGAINDIAFWSHPTLAFNGLIITGGENGVAAYGVESGAAIDGFAADAGAAAAVDVAYLPAADNGGAQGLLAVASPEGGARVYGVDNISLQTNPLATLKITAENVTGACVSTPDDETVMLYLVFDGSISRQVMKMRDDALSSTGAAGYNASPTYIDCAVDAATNTVFALSSDGDLHVLGETAFERIASTGAKNAAHLDIVLKTSATVGDDEEDEPAIPTTNDPGVIFVIQEEDGSHYLVERDGHALGRFSLTASFDIDAFDRVGALGAGYGNYGGVYRDGAIAIAGSDKAADIGDGEEDEKSRPAIRIAPWNAVMTGLSQPIGGPVDPRMPNVEEEDALTIDIDVTLPNQ